MATYKVLQDIEAEDKLLGPFTLKQFIFAGITIIIGFIAFQVIVLTPPVIMIPVLIVLLPPFLLFGFLAAPIGRDQTSETWLLARLRFLFKPRTRVWSQDGMKDLVTITVPKKIEHIYTKNFTQDEVRSRLQALANTVDSRGWAVKNVNANLFNQPDYIQNSASYSDRLIDPSNIPQEVPAIEVLPSDDMLDPVNNATAQHFDQLISQSSANHRQEVINNMQSGEGANNSQTGSQTTANPTQKTDYYFMHENNVATENTSSDYSVFSSQSVVAPGVASSIQVDETEEERNFARQRAEEEKRAKEFMTNHGKVLQPLHDEDGNIVRNEPQSNIQQDADKTRQSDVNPDIINFAGNNDLYIDAMARQAKAIKEADKPDDGEVIISLH